MFRFLKEGVNKNYMPNILLADCAEAITNGFRMAYSEEFKRSQCLFHVKKNLKKNFPSKIPVDDMKNIFEDIDFLQLAVNEDEFEVAKKVWIAGS